MKHDNFAMPKLAARRPRTTTLAQIQRFATRLLLLACCVLYGTRRIAERIPALSVFNGAASGLASGLLKIFGIFFAPRAAGFAPLRPRAPVELD